MIFAQKNFDKKPKRAETIAREIVLAEKVTAYQSSKGRKKKKLREWLLEELMFIAKNNIAEEDNRVEAAMKVMDKIDRGKVKKMRGCDLLGYIIRLIRFAHLNAQQKLAKRQKQFDRYAPAELYRQKSMMNTTPERELMDLDG
jgi:predicted nucleic acid binding AN1-type Zn finger protein